MRERFEYRFVRLKNRWPLGLMPKRDDYHEEVQEYASKGRRLVQIFAPGTGVYGTAAYFELIFERPVSDSIRD